MNAESLLQLLSGQRAMLAVAVFIAIVSIVAMVFTIHRLRQSTWRNGEASSKLIEELDRATQHMRGEHYSRKRAERNMS